MEGLRALASSEEGNLPVNGLTSVAQSSLHQDRREDCDLGGSSDCPSQFLTKDFPILGFPIRLWDVLSSPSRRGYFREANEESDESDGPSELSLLFLLECSYLVDLLTFFEFCNLLYEESALV